MLLESYNILILQLRNIFSSRYYKFILFIRPEKAIYIGLIECI